MDNRRALGSRRIFGGEIFFEILVGSGSDGNQIAFRRMRGVGYLFCLLCRRKPAGDFEFTPHHGGIATIDREVHSFEY
jgi:hypothetical protein